MFKPVKMPSASAPSIAQIKIDTFLGADLTNSPANVSPTRSPDCANMIRDVPGKVRKRMGWHVVKRMEGKINGHHAAKGKAAIIHAGAKLYKGDTVVYESANDARSTSWEMGGKIYIADGKALLCYDGEAVKRVDENAYIPTKTIARAPSGGGQAYEPLNLLQPKFKEKFLGTETDKTYQMSYAPLDAAPVVVELLQADGSWKEMNEGGGFSVDRTAGTIVFTEPHKTPVSGQDNIAITAARTIEGYADRINHCCIGTLFGVNGEPNRLFLSGNAKFINYDWFSAFNDPTYFADTDYSILGQSDSSIVGYSVINARLAAYKDSRETQRNIIVREGNLVDSKPSFRIVNMLQGESAIGRYTFGYLGTEPLFLTALGIYAITAQDITGEKYSQCRSFYLNGALLKEKDLQEAFALVYKDMYWLCVNGKAYILDGLQATQTDRADPYSTRQYAAFYCTNIPARVLWVENGSLHFGTQDGRVCTFYSEPTELLSYNDDGHPIRGVWRTPDFSGKSVYRNKSFSRFYVELDSAPVTSVKCSARVSGIWEELFSDFISARYFSYSGLTYSKFTYSNDDTPRTLGDKIRVKNVDKAGFRVENGQLNEPFGLNTINLEFIETGYYR